jgi:predicted RNase H-like HicB family nuclease
MKFTIVLERINEPSFPPDYYYAHIPSLGLTTHGKGIEGAKSAMYDLVRLWIEEKKANGEIVMEEQESYISTIELQDALFS